jgi:hypothetical protein
MISTALETENVYKQTHAVRKGFNQHAYGQLHYEIFVDSKNITNC